MLRKKNNRAVINVMFLLFAIGILFLTFHRSSTNVEMSDMLNSFYFIRVINAILGSLAVLAVGLLYKNTKNPIIFVVSLVYISLTISIITGKLDFITFLKDHFHFSDYMVLSVIILRVVLLGALIFNKSKLFNYLNKNRFYSIVFIIVYTVIMSYIEDGFSEKFLHISPLYFKGIYAFLALLYGILAIKLIIIGFKKNKITFSFIGGSLFLLGFKCIYYSFWYDYTSFNMKITSVFLTYISFLMVIIGVGIEHYLLKEEHISLNNELKRFYNLVNYNNHMYMFICDKSLNLIYMNQKIINEIEACRPHAFIESLVNGDIEKVRYKEIEKELYNSGTWRGVFNNVAGKDFIDCSIQILGDINGDPEVLFSFIDISERVKLESEIEARKLNDIKESEFLSTLSHELKTPLNIFYSTIQLLDNIKGKEEFLELYTKYSKTVKVNCKRMLRLINNIVDTTRIDLGAFSPEYGNYEIVSLIEDIAQSTVTYGKSKNISIQFDTEKEEHYLKCDPIMIEKIMLNLISNAIKYSHENTNIFIYLTFTKEEVSICVKDEGIGIPKEAFESIFERFSRNDSSLKRLNEGSGIGLSVVKSMVEALEGTITLKSKEGTGTQFKIKLKNKIIDNAPLEYYEFNEDNTELELSDIY